MCAKFNMYHKNKNSVVNVALIRATSASYHLRKHSLSTHLFPIGTEKFVHLAHSHVVGVCGGSAWVHPSRPSVRISRLWKVLVEPPPKQVEDFGSSLGLFEF